MPTYDYKCPKCVCTASVVQTIGDYTRKPHVPKCDHHGPMERIITVAPGFSGVNNALAGDRHYDGMRATDGTPIDSRTKHREYMKKNNLTTADDFKETWARAQKEREEYRAGTFQDKDLKREIASEVHKAIQN